MLPAVYGEVYAQPWPRRRRSTSAYAASSVARRHRPGDGLRLRSLAAMNVGALAFMGALVVGGAVRAPFRIAAACARFVGLMPREAAEATPADRAGQGEGLDLPPLPDIPDDVPPDTDDGNALCLFFVRVCRGAPVPALFCDSRRTKGQEARYASLHRAVRHGGPLVPCVSPS